ncbi:hypothetical protein ANO14919_039260 [Xylariales sp. No.14919]|nr:hypothetical protein ANO14919_039260 [Xylariales sp. No.14919]
MSQVAPACIIEKLAELGPKHLVVEGIMEEYIKKPILVYITFWELHPVTYWKKPMCDYGDEMITWVHCCVENYKTAFALLLANKSTKRMYESIRTRVSDRHPPEFPDDWSESEPEPPNDVSTFPRHETVDGELKPIDYHFLDNFHLTNYCIYNHTFKGYKIFSGFQPDGELKWWPNLVVNLREVWEVTKDCDINELTPISDRIDSYIRFFGVLAKDKIGLQDYLILVDRRGGSKRAHDYCKCQPYMYFHHECKAGREHTCFLLKVYYEYLNKRTSLSFDTKAPHCVIDHDGINRKLVTDLTAATIDDFDEEQYRWANCIAKCIKEWNAIEGIRPLNSFFVRWKTEEELQAEDERLNRQLMGESPATVSCDRIGELHDSPTHLFLHDKYPAGSNNGL